ncbi:hypothetical protein [[Bacillus] enclensis]|uniref:DUF3108 domain-containing protein n=1 Tax=[Bacillus] enclensis TaxID=1402860 RepID=UPI0018DC1B55|nr:hypothetical protein [[Bacillus] enclensis]MBH9964830.1 hypothetical protein [[Bacillus] enclensis]
MPDLTGIDGKALKEETDKKEVFLIENGNETRAGFTTETIKFGLRDGKEVIEREQALTSDILGNRKSITIVEKASFKPVSFTDYIDDVQSVKASYGDNTVSIEKEGKQYNKTLPGCYDTFSVEMILRALPLRSRYTLDFNGFNAVSESEVTVRITVAEEERSKKGPGEFVDAWKVKTYFGETLQYYWIDTVSKELLKQSSLVGEGLTLEFRR